MDLIREVVASLGGTAADVLPVALFMVFFQAVVLRQKVAHLKTLLVGLAFVTIGLALLLLGVDKALFQAGRMMVEQLSPPHAHDASSHPDWWSFHLIYLFAFCIAFAAALAEPALLAIAQRVNEISGGAINTWGLRLAAALGVAMGVALGCIRIVSGVPLHWCIAGIFAIILVQTFTAPRSILPLAYDSGGVSTTVVTVPVVAALGLGLAEIMPTRNPLLDGFGLIAFACLFPVVTVLGYAQIASLLERRWLRRQANTASTDDSQED
ncbi:MAG TPA: DUF1538 domain-containing protein [Gammaproteobacteria bacterium]